MLTASNESLSAKPFHSVTSAYLGREKPPMLVIIERERDVLYESDFIMCYSGRGQGKDGVIKLCIIII